MPENEFEKQVQQKMDEFRLRPSAPVWENIKDDLNERKRRRFFFMISLLAAALLFGWVGYNYFYTDTKIKTNQNDTAIKENTTIQSVTGNEPANNPEIINNKIEEQAAEKQSPDLTNTAGTKKDKEGINKTAVEPGNEITTGAVSVNTKNEKQSLKENSTTKQKASTVIVTEKMAKVYKQKNSNSESEKNSNKLNV